MDDDDDDDDPDGAGIGTGMASTSTGSGGTSLDDTSPDASSGATSAGTSSAATSATSGATNVEGGTSAGNGTGDPSGTTLGGESSEIGETATVPAGTSGESDEGDVTATQGMETGETSGEPACGNGVVESGEACDGDPVAQTCGELGVPDIGTLRCVECRFDLSGCAPQGMVLVPGGPFTMGDVTVAAPVRTVTLDAFYIMREEATVAAYAECVETGVCTEPQVEGLCNWGSAAASDYPINCISWYQAEAFCRGWGGRLPTEAEWEKAARGTDERAFPWGSEAPSCERVVFAEEVAGCGTFNSHPVGTRPMGASPYGALDMAGNLYEWTADWFAPYDAAALVNPTGPAVGVSKVLRGGSYATRAPDGLWVYRRHPDDPDNPYGQEDGVRCVQDLPER